jgi:hypothetical protein
VMGAGPVWKIGRSLVDRGDARGREGEPEEGTTAP